MDVAVLSPGMGEGRTKQEMKEELLSRVKQGARAEQLFYLWAFPSLICG
jgi:hypothetical protein